MAKIRIRLRGDDVSRWLMAKAWDREWWLEAQGVDPRADIRVGYFEEKDCIVIEGRLWKPNGWSQPLPLPGGLI